MTVDVWPGVFFRPSKGRTGKGKAKNVPGEQPKKTATRKEPIIRCRDCLQEITRPSARVARDGAHRHVFANPHGLVFEIGCFRSVTGCGHTGRSSTEFTWFSGYSWRMVFCGRCSTHLGWVFETPGQSVFYGLILKHLIEHE